VHKDGTKTVFDDLTEAIQFAAASHDPAKLFTMGQVLHLYQAEVTPTKSKRNQANEITTIGRLAAVFGDMPPSAITPPQIYTYLDKRKDTPISANNDVAVLSHAFTHAIKWGAALHNPCLKVQRFKKKPRQRYVDDAEFWAVHALASEQVQLVMELAYLTGLRRGDVLALSRDDVTEEGITVTPSKTKDSSGMALLIEWSDELRDVVKRCQQLEPRVRSALICNSHGNHFTASGFSSVWQRLMAKAVKSGIERYQFKDIRAKSASDDTLEKASERLGHTNKDITQRHYMRKGKKVRPLK